MGGRVKYQRGKKWNYSKLSMHSNFFRLSWKDDADMDWKKTKKQKKSNNLIRYYYYCIIKY